MAASFPGLPLVLPHYRPPAFIGSASEEESIFPSLPDSFHSPGFEEREKARSEAALHSSPPLQFTLKRDSCIL